MQILISGWFLPLVYFIGWLFVVAQPRLHWSIARATSLIGLVLTLWAVAASAVGLWLKQQDVDALGLVAALLVSLLGWVIIHFSSRYLEGDRRQSRFVGAILFTLASVGLLLLSRNLLVIVLAWSGTSVGLHFLLTHYPDRKAAQIVAHKKFLVSRMAELCLVAALFLIHTHTGTFQLEAINLYLNTQGSLPISLHAAAIFIVLAAILKTAQLPLHGWLIQVMEAPTPVSAMLHAGVINMGGFVLIRLAELISMVPSAQVILVIAGSTTAVLASLVMMTRVSIKVRLAWSTCAQMGFMLLEIGLGLYELALLHLVAHSLYKAHAFLSAGDAVETARHRDFLSNRNNASSVLWYCSAALVSGALVGTSFWVWQSLLPSLFLPTVTLVILGLGLAPLIWAEQGRTTVLLLRGGVLALSLTQLYLLWHLVFASIVPADQTVSLLETVWVILCFTGLYGAQFWLRRHPRGKLSTALYPWAYNGFYLDETFTRVTFKIWPARLSSTQAQTQVNRFSPDKGEMI